MRFVSVALLLTCIGCRSGPTKEEIADADHGPLPIDYKEIIKAHHEKQMQRGFSAKYRFITEPEKCWFYGRSAKYVFGWEVQADLNVKNRKGEYMGWRRVVYRIRDGEVRDNFLMGYHPPTAVIDAPYGGVLKPRE